MFWLIAAVLTALVTAAILRPLLRVPAAAEPAAAYDLLVYRDQLAEVERDLARKVISPDEASRLRLEIGRKVLDADRAVGKAGRVAAGGGRNPALVILAVALLGGMGLYLVLGRPGLPDMGLNSRIAGAVAQYDGRPSQAVAEADAASAPMPDLPKAPVDAEYLKLIDQLRSAVSQRPDDPQGFALLARHEAQLGNPVAAKDAQIRLIALRGKDASSADHATLAGLMIEAAGGRISPEAEAEIAAALQLDQRNPQARYMTGLLQAQNGRPDRAFPIWARLLQEGPENAPWVAAIRPVIGDLAWLAGQPDYTPPPAPALRGPDLAQIEAAGDMTDEERAAMVRDMVSQLESRLATEGGTPEEWGRLIRSLVVANDSAHAAELLTEARAIFADRPDAIAVIDAAAREAGLE